MASGDSSNLVQDFEDAFQKSLAALTEEEDINEKDGESVQKNIEEKVGCIIPFPQFALRALCAGVPLYRPGPPAGDFLPAEAVHDLQPQAGDDSARGHN